MKQVDIEKALLENDVDIIKKISKEDIKNFEHDEYLHLFLFAARHVTRTIAIQTLLEVLKKQLGQRFIQVIDVKDKFGRTALMLASINNNPEIVDYLIDVIELDIDERDNDGWSALTWSIVRNCVHSFTYFINNRAIIQKYDIQRIYQSTNITEYLLSSTGFLTAISLGDPLLISYYSTIADELSVSQRLALIHAKNDAGLDALQIASNLKDNIPSLNLIKKLVSPPKIVDRKIIANTITEGKDTRKGRTPIRNPEPLERPYRSFKSEREIQLLTNLSTQIYHGLKAKSQENSDKIVKTIEHLTTALQFGQTLMPYLKDKITAAVPQALLEELSETKNVLDVLKVTELQAMHLQYQNKNYLFIAMNPYNISVTVAELLKGKHNFIKMITSVYEPIKKEGRLRSARHAERLKNHIESHKPIESLKESDKQKSEAIVEILKKSEISEINIDYGRTERPINLQSVLDNIFKNANHTIFIVTTSNCKYSKFKERHAEEFLVDIAEEAKKYAFQKNAALYTCISGKKRPCFGCYGRMQGVIDNFNPRTGKFWEHTQINQPEYASSQTIYALLAQRYHFSLGKNNEKLYDYNTGSESSFAEEKGEEIDELFGRKLNFE